MPTLTLRRVVLPVVGVILTLTLRRAAVAHQLHAWEPPELGCVSPGESLAMVSAEELSVYNKLCFSLGIGRDELPEYVVSTPPA